MGANFRILLGSSTLRAGGQIKSLLLQKGFNVDGICTSGNMIIRKCRMTKPELVILNYELSDTNGAEVAKIICGEKISKVILLCTLQQYNFISTWADQLGLICMQKPIKPGEFIQTVLNEQNNSSKVSSSNKKSAGGRRIEEKRIIDKAKQILMKEHNLLEEEAYRKIQKDSMDSKMSMVNMAKIIIDRSVCKKGVI